MSVGKGAEKPSHKPRRGIVGLLFHLCFLVWTMSVLAWLCLVLWFGLQNVWQGHGRTDAHMDAIIQVNVQVLKTHTGFWMEDGYTAYQAGEKNLMDGLLFKSHAIEGIDWLDQHMAAVRAKIDQKAPQLHNTAQELWHQVAAPFLSVLLGVTVIVLTRVFIFLLALPVFLLLVGLGLVDGLVQRDVRKFQGARESTYLFHRIKRSWPWCFFVPLWMYLVWPWPLLPAWFLIPMAMWLGMMVQLSVRSFKKYV